MLKANINYNVYSDTTINPTAQTIHDGIANNATVFLQPNPKMDKFQLQISAYHSALAAAWGVVSKANTSAKNAAKAELVASLALLGGYINTVAQGDLGTLILSGAPYYDTVKPALPTPRPAPTVLSLKQNVVSGSIDLSFIPLSAADSQEIWSCLLDPSIEANWSYATTCRGSGRTIGGYTPGIIVYARVRSLDSNGNSGLWSAQAQMRVI